MIQNKQFYIQTILFSVPEIITNFNKLVKQKLSTEPRWPRKGIGAKSAAHLLFGVDLLDWETWQYFLNANLHNIGDSTRCSCLIHPLPSIVKLV